MASQMYGTSGGVRRRPTFVDSINAQRLYLPTIIANKANAKALQDKAGIDKRMVANAEAGLGIQQQANDIASAANAEAARANTNTQAYNAGQLDLTKRGMEYTKNAAEKASGLEMLKLGTTLAGSSMGKGIFDKLPGGSTGTLGTVGGGLLNAGVGGLAGFGASKLFGGKNKMKGALIGTGAGLLSGFLGGNWGNWGNMASSGIGGLLGGMFG